MRAKRPSPQIATRALLLSLVLLALEVYWAVGGQSAWHGA